MSLSKIGKILKLVRAIRVYKDGDGHGFIWRWWNPIAWVLAPTTIIFSILMQGAPETFKDTHDLGFGVNPWFITNPDRLEWLP